MPIGWGTKFPWTSAAAIMIQQLCRKKDIASIPRDLGWKSRVEEKKKQPRRNNRMDVKLFIQASGFVAGCPLAPRARNIVLPCRC